MASYVSRIPTPPRVLTEAEQATLLSVTGEHRAGFRDHMIIALALGTAAREHEIAGLDVGDVVDAGGAIKTRVFLRVFKQSASKPVDQVLYLNRTLRTKLDRLLIWKKRNGESVAPDAPLFVSRKGNRLSTRQMRTLFKNWQQRAGFARLYNFHQLRHSALSNCQRNNGDLTITRLIARHSDVRTTQIYQHPSPEQLADAADRMFC
jgi:integrase/recombinase XerC